jgi:nitrate/TMAO reductase-like tetraheme cytochrome c subunit
MFEKNTKLVGVMGAAVLLLGLTTAVAWADYEYSSKRYAMVVNSTWAEECGSCHLAFPPQVLPARSWRKMMDNLEDHFGSDASLDVVEANEISKFLTKNSSKKRVRFSGESTLRNTDTRHFVSEHDEISSRTWNNPKVKTAANCSACHRGAEQGNFDEDNVKIPR